MNNLLVNSLRIISFLLLPVGTFALTVSSLSEDESILWSLGIILAFFIFPLLVILFLHPKGKTGLKNNQVTNKLKFGHYLGRPTRIDLMLSVVPIIIGLIPIVLLFILGQGLANSN
jgi:hypothetical protein